MHASGSLVDEVQGRYAGREGQRTAVVLCDFLLVVERTHASGLSESSDGVVGPAHDGTSGSDAEPQPASARPVIPQHQTSSHAAAGPAGLATAFGNTFRWAVGFTALAFIPAPLLPTAPAAAAAPKPAAAEA